MSQPRAPRAPKTSASQKRLQSQAPEASAPAGETFKFRNESSEFLLLHGGAGPMPFPGSADLTLSVQQAEDYSADLAYFIKHGLVRDVSAE